MSDKLRIFIAIEIPTVIQDGLRILIESLRGSCEDARIRWVKPESIHLTLKFIGDIPHESVREITETLEKLSPKSSIFTLTVAGIGCFPNNAQPRVLWVGIREDGGKLTTLQKDIDLALEPLGIMPETRPYHAHLTVGRVKKPGTVGKLVSEMNTGMIGQMQVDKFSLIRSDLRPDGAKYSNLASFTLR